MHDLKYYQSQSRNYTSSAYLLTQPHILVTVILLNKSITKKGICRSRRARNEFFLSSSYRVHGQLMNHDKTHAK